MKTLMSMTICAAAAMLTAGCATVYRVSESHCAPEQGIAQTAPAMRQPIAAVSATPSDSSATRLAASLKASVENHLVTSGFKVTQGGEPDSTVVMEVSRREAARLDEWRTYEGTAEVRVGNAAESGSLVASKTFTVLGQRALDETKAEQSLKEELARRISEWLSKVHVAKKIPLPPPPPVPQIATAIVTISPADPMASPSEALAVQRRFMDAVAAHPGILSCRLDKEIPASRAFEFRVEYEPQSFPDGLLNTLVLDRPCLGGGIELEIVR